MSLTRNVFLLLVSWHQPQYTASRPFLEPLLRCWHTRWNRVWGWAAADPARREEGGCHHIWSDNGSRCLVGGRIPPSPPLTRQSKGAERGGGRAELLSTEVVTFPGPPHNEMRTRLQQGSLASSPSLPLPAPPPPPAPACPVLPFPDWLLIIFNGI